MRIVCIPAGTGGVAFYRIHQPYRYLRELGHDVFIFDQYKHDDKRLANETMIADAIVYQCPWAEAIRDSIALIKKGTKYGGKLKVVAEFDDDLFHVSPWNEKYNIFGTEEVYYKTSDTEVQEKLISELYKSPWVKFFKMETGEMLFEFWKDGHNGFDLKGNLARKKATQEIVAMSDLITVTTNELGKAMRKYRPHGPIAALPNLIDFDRWLPMEKNTDDTIRIGWQGGSAHFEDLHSIGMQLIDIAKKNPKVRFVFMGIEYSGLFEQIKDQIEWLPWHGNVYTYPLVVRKMKLDIAIAPLVNNKFNLSKSPLKWEEYSAMKVPCVASKTVYGLEIDHGKTGFIAEGAEWTTYLQYLIDNPLKREEIAQKASDRVHRRFGLDQAIAYERVFEDLCSPKKRILMAA